MRARSWLLNIPLLTFGCGNEAASRPADGGPVIVADGGTDTSEPPFVVEVPERGRVFVKLDGPAIVSKSEAWDVAFEGWDVFTNGGVSGSGTGAAFGPQAALTCLDDGVTAPILIKDVPGGAFHGWYAYDSTSHALYSRFHVYGVRDGDRVWKVQILGYYGEVAGAPTSAIYSVRWAETSGTGEVKTLTAIDATAGGPSAAKDAPSACLDLGTGTVTPLTVDQASASSGWHLCFRRDAITVNGEAGGPRGVTAVDLDAAKTAGEIVGDVAKKTAASEEPRFIATTGAALTDPTLIYRGDRVISAFSDRWFTGAPRTPDPDCWIVVGPDGSSRSALFFVSFSGQTTVSPGKVSLHARKLRALGGS